MADEKGKRLVEETQQKESEIQLLKIQQKSLKDEIAMIGEKLEQLQSRIQFANNELNVRKRKYNNLENQLNDKNKEKGEEHENEEDDDGDGNIEFELKDKILKLISNRQENDFDPNELFFYDGQRSEIKSNIAIHTVKIKLVQSGEQNSQKTFVKIVPRDCTFRIHKTMKFKDLKDRACEHWMINPSEFSLYTINFQGLEGEKLENAIEQHMNKNSIYPELWLLENAQYANKPDQFIDDPLANKSTLKINRNLNLTKAEKEFEVFKEIMEGYHHLKYYLPPVSSKTEENENKRLHGRDTSCCAFVFLILLLATTLFVITQRRNITHEFWAREKVYSKLNPAGFDSIVDQNTTEAWIKSSLSKALFIDSTDNSTDQILDYYTKIGPVVMRQGRSKESSCARSDLNYNSTLSKCYYKNVISGEKLTSSIYVGIDKWRQYNSSTDFKETFTGEFGVYDTSGYVNEFDQESSDSFISEFNSMLKNSWFSDSTRVIFISTNLYQATYDLWVVVYIVIEFSTNSFAYPSEFNVVTLQPNIVKKYPASALADVFRIIFSFYILYIYIATILEMNDGRRNLQHIVSFQGIMDLSLIISVIFSVAISLAIIEDEKEIFKSSTFTDLSYLINYYRLYHNSNAIALTLVVVRLLMFLTLNKRVFIYITTIRVAAKSMSSFFICLLLLLLGFTMVAQGLYGVYIYDFHAFLYSALSLFLFSMSHGKFEQMIKISTQWTAFFLVVFFVLIIFSLICVFSGVYMDTYRTVRLVEGYDDEKNVWTWKVFAIWLVDWLPSSIKRKIFFRKNKDKNDKEVEDEDELKDEDEELQEQP